MLLKIIRWRILCFIAISSIACSKKDSNSTTATVMPAPTADFSFSIEKSFAPTNVKFTSQSSNASIYFWSFGNNMISSDANPTIFYSRSGKYNVTLVVRNSSGSSSVTKEITVPNEASQVRIDKVEVTGIDKSISAGTDVYCVLSNSAGTELWRSGIFKNFSVPSNMIFSQPYTHKAISNFFQPSLFIIYRKGFFIDDAIGISRFIPDAYTITELAYPSSFSDTSNKTIVRYSVTWLK